MKTKSSAYPKVISLPADSINDAVRNALDIAGELGNDPGRVIHYWHDSKPLNTYVVYQMGLSIPAKNSDTGTVYMRTINRQAMVHVSIKEMHDHDRYTVRIERIHNLSN